MADAAIVIQNFNKPDTLEALCDSLRGCENRHQFDLIFWSDVAEGSANEGRYQQKTAEVRRFIRSFSADHGDQFRSISRRANPVNYGCYKTCRIAIDSAFEDHDFVILSEDDCIFAPDALNWFSSMRTSAAYLDDSVWAIAGESIFFDGQRVTPDARLIKAAKNHAIANGLWEKFISFKWVPSSCFATSRRKWMQFAATRGAINGDVEVCHRCEAEQKKCLFPVVARVKDTGMLHPDGYSVSIHSSENVSEIKNCYLMSGDIAPAADAPLIPGFFDGDLGNLYRRSTKLHGFEDMARDGTAATSNDPAWENQALDAARRAGITEDWSLALKLWENLKSRGVSTTEVETHIGLCLFKKGEREPARVVIQAILDQHIDENFARSIMAHILEADGDFQSARHIWRQLRDRPGLADWLITAAVNGERRCDAAARGL